MNTQFTNIFLFLFFAFSCVEKQENEIETSIDLADPHTTYHLSDLIAVDRVIPLKDSSQESFGEVQRAFFWHDQILLHTSEPLSIALLNLTGEVVKQITPNYQITGITSVHIFKDTLYVLDRDALAIHLLDSQMNYIKRVQIPYFVQSIHVIDSDLIALYLGNEVTDNTGCLIIYDIVNRTVKGDYFEISPTLRQYFNFFTFYNFYDAHGETFFWKSDDHHIYKLDESGTPQKAAKFVYGNRGIPDMYYEEAKFRNPYEFLLDARSKGYAHRHFKVVGNDSHLLINYDYGESIAGGLFNFQTNQSTSFIHLYDDIWNNKDMGEYASMFFVGMGKDNSFIGFIPFEYLDRTTESPTAAEDQVRDFLVLGRFK